jgi:hypothetical protein
MISDVDAQKQGST